MDLVYIKTNRGYWRDNSKGYCNDPADAGHYERDVAEKIISKLGPEFYAHLIPIDVKE